MRNWMHGVQVAPRKTVPKQHYIKYPGSRAIPVTAKRKYRDINKPTAHDICSPHVETETIAGALVELML